MGEPNVVQIIGIGAARDARNWLYKADHPRRIDRCIDFFGPAARDGRPQRRARAGVPGVSARTARSLVRGLAAALVLGTAMGGCAGLVGSADRIEALRRSR